MGGRAAPLAVALLVSGLLGACESGGNGGGEGDAAAGRETAPSTTSTTQPCRPGGRSMTLQGVRVRQFCGPALAEVTVGEELLVFPGGECARHEDWFALNVGFEVIDPEPGDAVLDPDFRSFTILMGRHPLAGPDADPVTGDGVFTEALVTFAVPGRSYLVEDQTVTLAGTRVTGTFSGAAYLAEAPDAPLPVEGVFTCDAKAIPLEGVPDAVKTLSDGETGG